MGVFHWDRLVGNYGFFAGWEQCLQSWLELLAFFWLVRLDRQNTKHVLYFTLSGPNSHGLSMVRLQKK